MRFGLRVIAAAAASVRPLTVMSARTPPVARRVPHTVRFGRVEGENRGVNPMEPAIEKVDDLFWLRDDTRKDEEILGLLREENAYTESRTSHLDGFRKSLYDEMLSHIQEDDDTYPAPAADGFEYWSRNIKGKPFRQYLRRPIGADKTSEELYLDVNAVSTMEYFTATEGWDSTQCDVHEVDTSPSGNLLAYAVDGSGYETYNIRLKDLTTGSERDDEVIVGTGGGLAWAGETTLFYVKQDEAHRPYQVWRHTIGTQQAEDVLVYEDNDELFNVNCWTTRDGALIIIESESKETTELQFVQTSTPDQPPTMVRTRQYGVRYDVDSHAPSNALLLTSNINNKVNRELLVASIDSPSAWTPLITSDTSKPVLPHSTTRSIDSIACFDNFLAVGGREGGFTQIWVVPLAQRPESATGGEAQSGPLALNDAEVLSFVEGSFTAFAGPNLRFAANNQLRLQYSSMTTPKTLFDYDINAKTYQTLKVQPVPNYDATKYITKRIEVSARDGQPVPVTLLMSVEVEKAGKAAPTHLYGYGSYGICMEPSFDASRLPLVDRGIVYAIAHIRGGGEMGHHAWYEAAGKYLAKRNTFYDFVDCAKHLIATGVTSPTALTCEGRSAGGLLVGNVVNDAPELFTAAIAGVPFVDLMTTMCDPSIPLTTEEWEEWGNPNEKTYYEYMLSYSPIDNIVKDANYPKMLLTSGLNDPRVAYWEPTKWAQVLRSTVANGEEILLKMDLAAGHFSAADRYRYLRELAFDFAWLLDQLGKADE